MLESCFHKENLLSKILKKFHIEKCKSIGTPLVVNEKLSNNDANSKADGFMCKSLMYLLATRIDTIFVASLLSKFMYSLSQAHYGETKWILRYIKGAVDYMLG